MIREKNFTHQESLSKLTPEQRELINDIRIGYGIPWSTYGPQRAVFESAGQSFLYQEIAFLYERIRSRLEDLYQKSETLSEAELAELIEFIEKAYSELTQKSEEASLVPGIQILPTLSEELVDQEHTEALRETTEEQNYVDGLFSDTQQRIERINAILHEIPQEERSDRIKMCVDKVEAVQDVMVDTINLYYEKNSKDEATVVEIKRLHEELLRYIAELDEALHDEYDITEASGESDVSKIAPDTDPEAIPEEVSETSPRVAVNESVPIGQDLVTETEMPDDFHGADSVEAPVESPAVSEEEVGEFELEAEENPEFASDIQYYRMWQKGLWGVLPTREWYKGTELHETRHTIGLTLRAAGYSAEKTARMFVETIDPWSEEVRGIRPRTDREPNTETKNKLNDLKRSIIDFVRAAITDREPDLSIFAKQYEIKTELLEEEAREEVVERPAEVESVTAVSPTEANESVPEKSEAVRQFETELDALAKEWEQIAESLPESKFTLERHRARIQSESARKLLNDERYPEKQKLERVGQILASFKRMIEEVKTKQGLNTPASEVAIEPETAALSAESVGESVGEPGAVEVPPLQSVAESESLSAHEEASIEAKADHEVLADMVEAVRRAHEEWVQFEATLSPYAFQFERERVGMFLSAMDSIIGNEDYAGEENVGKKIAKLGTQLEHFERMITSIRASQQAEESVVVEKERREENLRQKGIDPAAPTYERVDYTTDRQAERKRMGRETREARVKMDEANKEYNEALKQFILNQKMGASAVALYKRFKGEEVTSDLLDYLRKKADEQAETYRLKFTEWLDDREVGRAVATQYTSRSEEIHRRQQNKLVVNPYKNEQTALKEAKAEKSTRFWNEHARLKAAKERIMKVIPKSKTGRIIGSLVVASAFGAVAGTAAVGAVTGAVGGATFAFGRGVASMGMGMGAGALMNLQEGKKVDASKDVLGMTLRGEGDVGSLTLEDRRKIVRLAQAKVDKAELRRTIKTRATAVVVSFATRGAIGVADALSDFSGRRAAVEAASVAENPESPASAASAASSPEAPASAVSAPEAAASAPETLPAAEVLAGYEAVDLPRLDIKELHAPNGDPLTYELRVEGTELIAGNSDLSTINDPANLYEIKGAVRKVMSDTLKTVLDEKPNLPKAEVERIVFEKLQAKFGDTSWWKEADITEVRIDAINRVPLSVESSTPDPERALVESGAEAEAAADVGTRTERVTAPVSERVIGEQPSQRPRVEIREPARVKPEVTGGTKYESSGEFRLLSRHEKLIEREVAKYYPDAKQVRVITEVPEKALDGKTPLSTAVTIQVTTASGELVTGRGMAPVTERLSTLNLIDRAFQDMRGQAFAGFEPYKPVTGKLEIASSDPLGDFVETLNIDDKTGPTPAELQEAEMVARQTNPAPIAEQVAEARRIPPAPTEYVPSGKYLESQAYQKYLAENGVSIDELREQVLRTAEKLESKTYKDGWEEMKYRSPYAVLKDKTLGDIRADRLSVWGDEAAQRAYAAKYGFKYETLVAWADQLDYMMRDKSIPVNPNTTFEDYVTRFVGKMALAYKYNVDITPAEVALEKAPAAPIVDADRTMVSRGGRADTFRVPKSGIEGYKIPAAKIVEKVTEWVHSAEKSNAATGNNHESAYPVLSEMKLREVRDLQVFADKNPAKFQDFVKKHDLSPVVARRWMGLIDVLTEGRKLPRSNTSFGDWLEKRAAAVIKKEGSGFQQVNVSWSPRKR